MQFEALTRFELVCNYSEDEHECLLCAFRRASWESCPKDASGNLVCETKNGSHFVIVQVFK